ncbi:hypothetical protein Q8F57_037710 [Paraburkholderia terrae]|uniref:hypothetical protein n=1 Tax=Paraburkholderia terrae TaxID=311230 RepID=UPI00296AD41F|nr:hypothetical protein [Paraburkholderia terrae]MDW3662006.1 hypothetical protein [Paraburkholderia terrae]
MSIYRGTHGTSTKRADLIQANGFEVSAVAKAGSGVYLWAYADDSSTARDLAIGWYWKQVGWRKFADELKPNWSVLYAEVEADDDACFDCNTIAFREALFGYLRKLGRANDEGYTDDDLCAAYNTLIKRVEAKVGREFCVIHTCVTLPKGVALKEKVAGGDPFVHIVRKDPVKLRVIDRENESDGDDMDVAVAVAG